MRTHQNTIPLGIKPQFADKILDGSKIHTCRKSISRKGWEFQVGDKINFYTGLLTKSCKFVASKEIVRIDTIKIRTFAGHPLIHLQNSLLIEDISNEFAKNDGFVNEKELISFFNPERSESFEFLGFCIFWSDFDYS